MKVISKFKIGKNVYVIVLKNNKYKVGRLINNSIDYNLNSEEKKIISIVIDNILPDDRKINLLPIKINSSVYNVSVSHGIYLFNPIPNEIDLKILNNIFNNQSEYVYIGQNKSNNNYIKRFIKIGKTTIIVLLSSTIVLSSSSALKADINEQFSIDENIVPDKIINIVDEKVETIENDELPTEVVEEIQEKIDNNREEEIDKQSINQFDFSKIIEVVNNNPNLGEVEKNIILSNKYIFEDNYEYLNYDRLLNLLGSVQVVYNEANVVGINGQYNINHNIITVNNTSCFSENIETTFTHELSHLIQNSNDLGDCSFLIEGTNALANYEYYRSASNADSSYLPQRNVIQALNIIFDNNLFKEYYNNNDKNLIRDELYKIYPDYEKADIFIEKLNYYHQLYHSSCIDPSFNYLDTLNETLSYINDDLKFYYEVKYQRSYEDDLLMLYFIDNNAFINKFMDDDIDATYNVSLESYPSIISSKDKNKSYSFNLTKTYQSGYNEEDYEECLNAGLISEDGETYIAGLIIDKDNNRVLRPTYSMDETLIEINDNNRYINNNLSR